MRDVGAGETLHGLGPWGFVGAGALGASLARALAAAGAHVAAVTARRPERAVALAASLPECASVPAAPDVVRACGAVVLAVPDDAIAALDAALPWRSGQLAVHLSGARGLDALPQARAAGAHVAALHPLMIFPRAEPSGEAALAHLAGCAWAVEASDAETRAALEAVVAALGGRAISLQPQDRIPYHLAAVLSSNYVVTLLGAAVAIWQDLGLDPALAREALLPLLRATVDRLAADGPAAALAGPVARGDVGTVAAHLGWLGARAEAGPAAAFDPADLRAAYLALAKLTVPLARARGSLTPDAAERLLALLHRAVEPDRDTP